MNRPRNPLRIALIVGALWLLALVRAVAGQPCGFGAGDCAPVGHEPGRHAAAACAGPIVSAQQAAVAGSQLGALDAMAPAPRVARPDVPPTAVVLRLPPLHDRAVKSSLVVVTGRLRL